MRNHKRVVSVVIPCYNAQQYLRETLESAVQQSVEPLEVVVVDDSSSDDSAAIAESFGNPVRVIRQMNQGECAARNRGIEEAQGDWIAFLDADDVWKPQKLERQLEEVKQYDDLVCVHTGFFLFGMQNGVPEPPLEVRREQYKVETLLLNPLVNSSTAMVRAGLQQRFPARAKQGGDMLYFTELSQHGRFVYISEPLAGYRMHANQVTRQGDAWVRHFENRFRWVSENAAWLGDERSHDLNRKLRQQVLEWLDLARWNRQWQRYWTLRAYAEALDWDGKLPDVLQERLYPRAIYWAKDVWDRMRPNRRRKVNATLG